MVTEVVDGTAAGGLIGEALEQVSRLAPGSLQPRLRPRRRRLIRLPHLSFMAIPTRTLTRYTAIRHDGGVGVSLNSALLKCVIVGVAAGMGDDASRAKRGWE